MQPLLPTHTLAKLSATLMLALLPVSTIPVFAADEMARQWVRLSLRIDSALRSA